MNQHPFNNSEPDNSNGLGDINNTQPPINQEVELTTKQSKELKATKKSLKRFILILLAIGVSLGAVLSIATIIILDHFNLSDPPAQVDEPSE